MKQTYKINVDMKKNNIMEIFYFLNRKMGTYSSITNAVLPNSNGTWKYFN